MLKEHMEKLFVNVLAHSPGQQPSSTRYMQTPSNESIPQPLSHSQVSSLPAKVLNTWNRNKPLSGVSKTILSFNDLVGFTELKKVLYSWLWFITVKTYRLKLAKKEGTKGRIWHRSGMSFYLSSPSGVVRTALNSPSNYVRQYSWSIVNQGSSSEPVSSVIIGSHSHKYGVPVWLTLVIQCIAPQKIRVI